MQKSQVNVMGDNGGQTVKDLGRHIRRAQHTKMLLTKIKPNSKGQKAPAGGGKSSKGSRFLHDNLLER